MIMCQQHASAGWKSSETKPLGLVAIMATVRNAAQRRTFRSTFMEVGKSVDINWMFFFGDKSATQDDLSPLYAERDLLEDVVILEGASR
eukprot:gene19037-25632_t